MIFKLLSYFVLCLVINDSLSEKHSFVGYKLLRLTPESEDHLKLIREWEHNPEFDFWNRKTDMIDVLLSPTAFEKYEKLFKALKIKYSILVNNIQEKIDMETKSMEQMSGKRQARNIVGKFARYSEINNFVDEIVNSNSDIASSYLAGRTFENRDLKVLVLKTSTSSRSIWIDCGFHAREWIAISTCVWLMDKIVKDYRSGNAEMTQLLSKYEFHIMPLTNPDGYEYSHTTYRLWRKNRRVNTGSSCIGVDLNRNFGFQWMTGGSSTLPCSDTYAGPSRDSELETQALENAILKKKGDWDAYLTIHTYGQYWLCSWSYTTLYPPDFDEICSKAKIGVDGIKTYAGTQYTYGHSGQLFGKLSGVSDDWAKGNATIKYSYTLELSPGDTGVDAGYGFELPESRAPRVGEETYIGIKTFLKSLP